MSWTWSDEVPWMIALALATPLGGGVVWWFVAAARGRLLIALAVVGPLAAALWALQLGLMAAMGFASPWAALALIAIAASAGAAVGWWVRNQPATSTASPDKEAAR